MDFFAQAMTLIQKAVTTGGAIWLVVGVVIFGIALKDKNGPDMRSGLWQIVGGGLITAAGVWFGTITW